MSARTGRGFTLIEVLVALTLLSLLSVGLITTFRAGQGAYARVVHTNEAGWNVVIAQRSLRRLLESAYPFEPAEGADEEAFGLQGNATRLAVSAPMPLAAGGSGYYRYGIELESGTGGANALVVRTALDRNGASRGEVAKEVLLEGVAGVAWSYLDAPGAQRWRGEWNERRPPALVRLRVSFPDGDPRTWPDLVAAPRITDDANCDFDVVSQSCRESGA